MTDRVDDRSDEGSDIFCFRLGCINVIGWLLFFVLRIDQPLFITFARCMENNVSKGGKKRVVVRLHNSFKFNLPKIENYPSEVAS